MNTNLFKKKKNMSEYLINGDSNKIKFHFEWTTPLSVLRFWSKYLEAGKITIAMYSSEN